MSGIKSKPAHFAHQVGLHLQAASENHYILDSKTCVRVFCNLPHGDNLVSVERFRSLMETKCQYDVELHLNFTIGDFAHVVKRTTRQKNCSALLVFTISLATADSILDCNGNKLLFKTIEGLICCKSMKSKPKVMCCELLMESKGPNRSTGLLKPSYKLDRKNELLHGYLFSVMWGSKDCDFWKHLNATIEECVDSGDTCDFQSCLEKSANQCRPDNTSSLYQDIMLTSNIILFEGTSIGHGVSGAGLASSYEDTETNAEPQETTIGHGVSGAGLSSSYKDTETNAELQLATPSVEPPGSTGKVMFNELDVRIKVDQYSQDNNKRVETFKDYPLLPTMEAIEMAMVGFVALSHWTPYKSDALKCAKCGLVIWNIPESLCPLLYAHWELSKGECQFLKDFIANRPRPTGDVQMESSEYALLESWENSELKDIIVKSGYDYQSLLHAVLMCYQLPISRDFLKDMLKVPLTEHSKVKEAQLGIIRRTENRNHTMRCEEKRTATFLTIPLDPRLCPVIEFVEAGWFWIGTGLEMQCCTCNIVHDDWSKDVDPFVRHFQLKIDCEFLRSHSRFKDVQEMKEKYGEYIKEDHQGTPGKKDVTCENSFGTLKWRFDSVKPPEKLQGQI